MNNLKFENKFIDKVNKIKDKLLKEKVRKQVVKISLQPTIGKPMRHERKGTREVYLKPFRISYRLDKNKIIFLELYHKDKQ